MHVMLGLTLGDHEGLAHFVYGRLLKRTLLIVLPVILIQILIRVSLSPVPVCCRGHSRTAWCCLAAAGGTPVPGIQLWETQCGFCIFCFIYLIINGISNTSCIQFVSLPFPASPFLWWKGGG